METSIELSVIIPAYLEEENLRVILPRLNATLRGVGRSYEVLVIESEKPMDNSRSVCESNDVICESRTGGDRYGNAVRTGIAKAAGRLILFMDADGSHSPEFIPKMLEHADTHHIVIASRYIEGGATENPTSLIWMSRILNLIYTVFLNIPCRDVSNSFKIYHSDVLKNMNLDCQNFDIVEEIIVKYTVAKKDLAIKEVPFVFKTRMFGITKRNLVAFIFSFLATLIRLYLMRIRAKK